MPESEGVGDRRVGLRDGEICRLPKATKDEVLQRGDDEWEVTDCLEVIGRPKAEIREQDEGTTVTGSMTKIVEKTITLDKDFHLAKILVTWPGTDEQHIQVLLGDEVVGEYYATAYVIDWFAWGTKETGDGTKTAKIQAQATATGATLIGFINGEEV